MNPEMSGKIEAIKGNLAGGKLVGKAMQSSQGCPGDPCEDSGEDMCSREGTSYLVKRLLKQKSERIAALQQLSDLFDAGHIKDSSPLESLIYEWLRRDRQF